MITINDKQVEVIKFPNNEIGVKINPQQIKNNIGNRVNLGLQYESSDDIIALMFAVNAIRNMDFNGELNLYCYLLPYSRQDRVTEQGTANSLKIMVNILNSLNFDNIYVADIHSDVGRVLFTDGVLKETTQAECLVYTLDQHYQTFDNNMGGMQYFIEKHPNIVLIAPDAGAAKKIYDCQNKLTEIGCNIIDVVIATKHRDLSTGKINKTSCIVPKHENCLYLVIDDLCDGGQTFIELAKVVRPQIGDNQLNLYVTHGLFTKGKDILLEYFDKVMNHN